MRSGSTQEGNMVKRLGIVGERLGYLLHRTDLLHMQYIRAELSALGLTPARATALAFIHENEGCRQNDLGQALGINRSSTMEVVNSLVGLNLMERRNSPDRRANSLFLTDKGELLFEQFLAISRDVDDVIAASLSENDKAVLVELMTRMTASLETAHDRDSGRETELFSKPKIYAIS